MNNTLTEQELVALVAKRTAQRDALVTLIAKLGYSLSIPQSALD